VADRLRRDIERGVRPPGTRLRQATVAAEFGVSTTPVREAFNLLRAEGFVEIDPHRGAIVFQATAADILEAYEIREELEALAARHAVERLTDSVVSRMEGLLHRMDATDDHERLLKLNYDFHDALYRASARPRLCAMIDSARVAASIYIRMYVNHLGEEETRRHYRRVAAEHLAILDAARARDVAGMDTAVRAHLRSTVEGIVTMLNHQGS
jgi:DNA-binding GntR family transcriptional regulator